VHEGECRVVATLGYFFQVPACSTNAFPIRSVTTQNPGTPHEALGDGLGSSAFCVLHPRPEVTVSVPEACPLSGFVTTTARAPFVADAATVSVVCSFVAELTTVFAKVMPPPGALTFAPVCRPVPVSVKRTLVPIATLSGLTAVTVGALVAA